MKKFVLVYMVFAMLLLSGLVNAGTILKQGTWSGNNHKYVVVDYRYKTWDESVADMKSLLGDDYYLATITSQAEQDFVNSLMESITEDTFYYWLGGYQPKEETRPKEGWIWVTGETWSYTNWWSPYEPNDYHGVASQQHLAIIWPTEPTQISGLFKLTDKGKWDDGGVNLNGLYGYIAESGDVASQLTIEIIYPTEEETYTSQVSPIEIRGTASDNVVSVTWENAATGEKGACSGTKNWTCQVPLVGGNNVIKATAKDADGREEVDQITVSITFLSDLAVNPNEITLSNPKPGIGERITITAIIRNLGRVNANNVCVCLYSISQDGSETQIGSDHIVNVIRGTGMESISSDWLVTSDTQHIKVVVDPPLKTGGSIQEKEEDNNKAGIVNTKYRPDTNGFAFSNYPYSTVPSWLPEWYRSLGIAGHCLGMSITSLVYYNKGWSFDCNPPEPGIPPCRILYPFFPMPVPVWLPPCLTRCLIEYNQLLFLRNGIINNSMMKILDYKGVKDEYITLQYMDLESQLYSGPKLLILTGHAVVAYKIGYSNDLIAIYVYDPNFPGWERELKLSITATGLLHMNTYNSGGIDYDMFCVYEGPFTWYEGIPLSILSSCPVDLCVSNPDGLTVSKESAEIPISIYLEDDVDGDDDPDDIVIMPIVLSGAYVVKVIPESDAMPTDTYTIRLLHSDTNAGDPITIVENGLIQDIPVDGYTFELAENPDGTLEIIIPFSPISTVPEENPALSISPEKLSIQKDDTFTVNIEVNKITDLFGASFELQFNGDILETTGAKPGDALGSDVVFLNVPSKGKISVAISKKEGDEPFSGSGTLASIDFRAKADGKTEITFDKSKLTLQKADGSPIPDFSELTITPCEITIVQISQAMISMVPSDFQVKPGDEFTLKAVVSDIDRLFGASFEIQYDGNILDYVSSSAGDFMGSDVVFFSIKGDNSVNMAISMKAEAEPASGSGALAEIKFKARSAGKSQVSYREDTLALKHPDGTPISVTVSNCSVTVGEGILKGDVNNDGNVRSNDAILALRIASGLIEPTPEQRQAADMNGDGMVRSNDAILILREAAGLAAPDINTLPTANRKVTVTLPESHGVAGERLTIPLKVDNAGLLTGGDICITYDDTVLRVLGVESNLMLVSNIRESGRVYISFADVQGLRESTLADIEFDILKDSVSSLEFDTVEFYQPDALPLASGRLNGRFISWAIPPERSDLMQNFPNPFNPDTWIPYQLREAGEVTVRIHSITGEIVRELKLGYKSAGLYVTKDRAAYWNGKSDAGELVSSGVYFYTIQAGSFRSTSKMTVMR